MKLGELIAALKKLDGSKPVKFRVVGDAGPFKTGDSPGRVDSYRGYYERLAIGKAENPATVASLIEILSDANGSTFSGYKGGEFTMTADTIVHAAEYGSSAGGIILAVESDENSAFLMISDAEGYQMYLAATEREEPSARERRIHDEILNALDTFGMTVRKLLKDNP